jgi:hypothetical protein
MLEKIKGAIKNRQSRDTSNIVYKTQWKKQRQTKNKKNTENGKDELHGSAKNMSYTDPPKIWATRIRQKDELHGSAKKMSYTDPPKRWRCIWSENWFVIVRQQFSKIMGVSFTSGCNYITPHPPLSPKYLLNILHVYTTAPVFAKIFKCNTAYV